jgi:cytochrome c peroxidase
MSRRSIVLALSAASVVGAATVHGDAGAGGPDTDRESARVELGRRLFFDPALGRQGRIGCASCHDPEHGFSDARVHSIDESGELPRHSQPLTDLGGQGFHWDGEFDTAREVVEARIRPRSDVALSALGRTLTRAESALASDSQPDRDRLRERTRSVGSLAYYGDTAASVAPNLAGESPADGRLAQSGLYAKGFTAAFGSPEPTTDRIVDAVDAYVRSLKTGENALDRFLAGNERALLPSARRGLTLFTGRAGCARCHVTEPRGGRAPLTDGAFHDTGIGWDTSKSDFADRGAGAPLMQPRLDGTFKTPSLRDVARRAPYMHDGRFATLEQVVRYYDAGGTPHDSHDRGGLDPRIVKLGLSDGEVADLVAFLASLSGPDRAGLGAKSITRPKKLRIRVVDFAGAPQRGMTVEVRPAGDRLRDGDLSAAARMVVTDAAGEALFPWPLSTHARVACRGIETVPVGLVPDYVDVVEFVTLSANCAAYALPTGICERADVLLAHRTDAHAPEERLTRVRAMHNGRSLYVVKGESLTLLGRYELTTLGGVSVGTYELAGWRWTPSAVDLTASPSPTPAGRSIDDATFKRLRKVLDSMR